MKRIGAVFGSGLFLLIAPGTVAGVVPWWISRWRMEPPLFAFAPIRLLGLSLILAGLPCLIDSFARFALQGIGTPAPVAPTRHLVITGLYRHVRNPMYVSVASLIFGQGLLLGNKAVLAYGAVVAAAFHLFVLLYEEPSLRLRFGAEYEAYRAAVPRWIPRLSPWTGGHRALLGVFPLTMAATALPMLVASGAWASQPGEPSPEQLAKQLANPVASLVSVPFQSNWDFGTGAEEDTRYLLNFQPVMPFSLNERWNLIGRVIVPVLSQPAFTPGDVPQFGLGDFIVSGFLSPKVSSPIWGIGPVFMLPISSNPALGSEKWGVGPTAVVLKQSGGLTMGALANHIWSFGGDEDRADVNQTFIQPFVSVVTPKGITLTLLSETTANWEAREGDEWTIPLILQVSKVVHLGTRPVNLGIGGGPYLEAPLDQPDWRLRLLMVLLYPVNIKR